MSQLAERFEILDELGEGGMGRVYAALDRRSGRRLALKTLVSPDPLKLALLKREARIIQGIVHPNLVTLHGLEQLDDTCVLSMELVDGVPLDRYVSRGSLAFPQGETLPLPASGATTAPEPSPRVVRSDDLPSSQLQGLASIGVAELSVLGVADLSVFDVGDSMERSFTESIAGGGLATIDLELPADDALPAEPAEHDVPPRNPEEGARIRACLEQLARAVSALHSVGRVHRDIKPANVLVERGGRVVLLDFGLALEVDVDSGKGQALGTPGFMAPEQLRGDPVTQAADWYAFGAIIYLMLVGRPPYEADRPSYTQIARGALPRRPHGRTAPELQDLADLCWDLLQPDPEARPAGAEVLDRLGVQDEDRRGMTTTRRHAVLREWTTRSGQVLFGRDEQLAALDDAWGACAGGRTGIAAVHGPSGSGTSAILDGFCEERDDALVLRGRCYELDSVPYAGWDALVDALADALSQRPDPEVEALLPANVTWLARVFPVLQRVRAVAAAEGAPPPEDERELRDRAFAALGLLLSAVAHRQPLVVRLDDLHWASPDSLALVLRLVESPPEAPLLVLLSWREGTRAASQLEPLLGSRRCIDVPMLPLSGDDASALARHLLSPMVKDRGELADRIAREAGGLPLLIRELALGVERGTEVRADLGELIRRRVLELPEAAQDLLQVAALIGRPVNLAIAAEVAGCDQPELAARVLVAEDLLRSSEEGGVRQIECINSRVRDAVREAPSPQELGALHAAMAERTSAERDPEGKGRHLLAAGHDEEAGPLLLKAADRALGGLAFERAVELFALSLGSLTDPEDRRRCAWGEARALSALGRARAAADHYLAAAEGAPEEDAQRFRRRATEQLCRAGYFVEARDLLAGVLGSVGVRLSKGPLLTMLRLIGHQLVLRLRGTGFRVRAEADVPARLLARIDTTGFVTQALALFAPVQAAHMQALHLRLALKAGEPERAAMALGNESGFAAALGGRNVDRADGLLAASLEAGRGLDAPRLRAVQAIARSIITFQRGQWSASRSSAERAAEIARMRCRDGAWELGTAAIYILTTLSLQGEHARVADLLPWLVREEADRGNQYAELHLILSQPVPLPAVQGRPAEGRAEVLDAWGRWAGLEWGLLELYALRQLIELALYERDLPEARARVDELWAGLRSSQARFVRITTLFAHASRLRVSLRSLAAGEGLLPTHSQDRKALAKSGMVWGRADALAADAQVAHAAGQDGSEELRAAAELFGQAGMRTHAAACALAADDPELSDGPLSGHEGAAWLREQGVVDATALCRMLLPGL